MVDVLPSTLAILVHECFFSIYALLKNRGHVLITKIDEASVIGQTWSIGLTGRPSLETESDLRFRDNLEGLNNSLQEKTFSSYIYEGAWPIEG
jgi:hypothetical protein